MKVKEAVKITGSMTRTSKMPGLSYSLPAWECQVGSKLRAVKGSVCSGCYALKGNYTRYPAIKAAQYYRLQSLRHPQWIPAIAGTGDQRHANEGLQSVVVCCTAGPEYMII